MSNHIRSILIYLLLLSALPAMSNTDHGDHLGSANWITDSKGDPVQYKNRIMNFAPYNVLQHFHTHGHADTYNQAITPSQLDFTFKNEKATPLWPSIQLLILHNYGLPIRY